ncbi:MAG TPA: hypothetical protein PLG97_07620, partial [Alcaligenes sp.]|nr:hypothetical protein [Alcaligenes sp.]HRL27371.1 hypothetical protein [Alcaligenes sp.]
MKKVRDLLSPSQGFSLASLTKDSGLTGFVSRFVTSVSSIHKDSFIDTMKKELAEAVHFERSKIGILDKSLGFQEQVEHERFAKELLVVVTSDEFLDEFMDDLGTPKQEE